jgi:hypothetical protein
MKEHSYCYVLVIFLLLLLVGSVNAENTGHVYVTIRCMNNIFSRAMILTSFTNNNADIVWVSPDGKWDSELIPGSYALILLDGNSGQREYRFFDIREGMTTMIDQFIGHAISGNRCKKVCVPFGTPWCDWVWNCGG